MQASVDVDPTDVNTPVPEEDVVRAHALPANGIDVALRTPACGDADELRFTMYVSGNRISLSTVLPILHSLGAEVIDERPHRLRRSDGTTLWIYDFTLRHPHARAVLASGHDHRSVHAATLPSRFCTTFLAAWHGRVDVDAFNRLIAVAGLTCEQAALLRAYAKYLRQIGFPYGMTRIVGVLADHPYTCATLVELFVATFDPRRLDATVAAELDRELQTSIEGVLGLDADRILRAYADLIGATTRTNFYREPSAASPRSEALSFKLDARSLQQLPTPRPRFEVFVYSPRVEGVHLRYGKVARGGLRWSDRLEDFRTETLGLVKAQAVKNAVIVPVGAKGGFVAKRLPTSTGDPLADRDAQRREATACYTTFVAALLDVTDTIDPTSGEVVAPADVVCRDGEDPYLAVAADKGTADFSDLANAVAAQYGYWMGDAFASGGSVGYDHKAMGITAKGSWASVRRHFRELSLDVDTQDFTVVGIGDMSGDVFGNAMLLSPHIRLVAAFDHRHVFIDPQPDPESSLRERRRLFDLPRSSWADYDPALISSGGGVFPRTAKTIPLTVAMRAVLAISEDVTELSPPEVISRILQAPVDLLFNGGVGTYVKASNQTHLDAGDKSNDAVRVDASTVRAHVVCEGGNLGVTSAGRIELAQQGVRVNTDALDNSAGVDCSDHEVNIKILLDTAVTMGRLGIEQRQPLLREMTDDVAEMVLANNTSQNELLGTTRSSAADRIAVHGRQLALLARVHGMDRALEGLPEDREIERRAARSEGLTSPELATLTAHVKLALKADLLASNLIDHDAFADRLTNYFPIQLRKQLSDAIAAHPLRREIISTVLTNEIVDTAGVSYLFRLSEDTGASTTDAVRAFSAASAIMNIPTVLTQMRTAHQPTVVSDAIIAEVRRLIDRTSRWLLLHRPQPIAVGAEIKRYRAPITALLPHVARRLDGPDAAVVRARAQRLHALGADLEMATHVYSLLHGFCGLDVVDIADVEGCDVDTAADLYYSLNAYLGVDHLLSAISALPDTGRWDSLARQALRDDLYGAIRTLTRDVIAASSHPDSPAAKISEWVSANVSRMRRSQSILRDILDERNIDVTALAVAVHQVRDMVRMQPA